MTRAAGPPLDTCGMPCYNLAMSNIDPRLETMREWADKVTKEADPRAVPADHVPTANERNNVAYLSMKYVIGWLMRPADLAVVEMMVPDKPRTVDDLKDRYCAAMGEYMWDHLMGEPAEPTQEEIIYACRAMAETLFAMPEHERNSIETTSTPEDEEGPSEDEGSEGSPFGGPHGEGYEG